MPIFKLKASQLLFITSFSVLSVLANADSAPEATPQTLTEQPISEPISEKSFFGLYGQVLRLSADKAEEEGIGSSVLGIGVLGGRILTINEKLGLMFNIGGGLNFADDNDKFNQFATYGDSNFGEEKSSSIGGFSFRFGIDAKYKFSNDFAVLYGVGIDKFSLRRKVDDCYGCKSEDINLDNTNYLTFGFMNRLGTGNDNRYLKFAYRLIKGDDYGHFFTVSILRIYP